MKIQDFLQPSDFDTVKTKTKHQYPFLIRRTRKTENGYIRLFVEGFFVDRAEAERWAGNHFLINFTEQHEFFKNGMSDVYGITSFSIPAKELSTWAEFRDAASSAIEEFTHLEVEPLKVVG